MNRIKNVHFDVFYLLMYFILLFQLMDFLFGYVSLTLQQTFLLAWHLIQITMFINVLDEISTERRLINKLCKNRNQISICLNGVYDLLSFILIVPDTCFPFSLSFSTILIMKTKFSCLSTADETLHS